MESFAFLSAFQAFMFTALGVASSCCVMYYMLHRDWTTVDKYYEQRLENWKRRYADAFRRIQQLEAAIDNANDVRHQSKADWQTFKDNQ